MCSSLLRKCFQAAVFAILAIKITEQAYIYHSDAGTIRTPGFPREYPPNQDVSYTILLQPYEKIIFGMHFRDILLARFDCPKFGQGDYLEYYINGTKDRRLKDNDDLYLPRLPVTEGVTNVTIRFVSDDEWSGCGVSIHYKISCGELRHACFNSGVCILGRTSTKTKPVQCLCPDGFTGPRCESRAIQTLCHPGCMKGERCVVDTSTKKAICESQLAGWRHVPGQGMVDIDECQEGDKNISAGALCEGNLLCFNTPGSYYCGCDTEAGFVLVTDSEGKKQCEQGCQKPWIMFNKECYLFQDDLKADAESAKKWCAEMGGHLASVKSIEENAFVGKHAKAALTWIDVSDVEGERNFTSGSDKPGGLPRPQFGNWGPGFPDGSGDYAVMYPNRWTKGVCSDKKRFICQAKIPFCPSNWHHPDNSEFCYHQSSMVADHLGANHICKYLAIGGFLSPWRPFEATTLGPSFWQTSPGDEGLAHYWVGIVADKQTEMAMYTVPNATLSWESPGTTYEGTAAGSDETGPQGEDPLTYHPSLKDSGIQVVEEDGTIHMDMSLAFHCGFVYPNKWADYAYNGGTASDSKPGFVCTKSVKGSSSP